MTFGSLLLLAVGLAMDATAAAAARGCVAPRLLLRDFVIVAVYFGGFQALMPLFGALLGAEAMPFIGPFDHWIAFVILGLLGAKMIYEGLHEAEDEHLGESESPPDGHFSAKLMLPLAVATSIDALAAGFTLPAFNASLAMSIATIGFVTAALSALGLYLGRRFGAHLGSRLELIGGGTLCILGVSTLVRHLSLGI